jgi:hypothetical protein
VARPVAALDDQNGGTCPRRPAGALAVRAVEAQCADV